MISLILADAEIEPIPSICSDGKGLPRACSVKDEQLRGILVLDSYLHRHILEGLEQAERRGRPDIVHSFLLLVQGSEACRKGRLRSYIHTKSDEVVVVGQGYAPEQNYLAFLKSLSDLFSAGNLGTEAEGMRIREHMPLKELLEELAPDEVVVLTPSGYRMDLVKVLEASKDRHLAVIIGGFPKGDFHSPVHELADVRISLGDKLLTVPDVTARVLSSIP